jgi:hypothetical protein
MKKSDIKFGAKVQSIAIISRAHEFQIKHVITGTVVELCSQQFAVKVDGRVEGLKVFDNLISYDYTNFEFNLFKAEWKYL